jgi:lipoprotein-anchoring transpeptidase ErfK/SrfK
MFTQLTKIISSILCLSCIFLSSCISDNVTNHQNNSVAITSTKDTTITFPTPSSPTVDTPGKVIVVQLSRQWLWAYIDGKIVFDSAATTGQPDLETPTGTYHIQFKLTEHWFISPWPKGSPYYYKPQLVHYALYFLDKGFYIHDAPWRQSFGPGSNVPHTLPDGTAETGSHGCVQVPVSSSKWLYEWAPEGTEIQIIQ